jgi:hypothetical protein
VGKAIFFGLWGLGALTLGFREKWVSLGFQVGAPSFGKRGFLGNSKRRCPHLVWREFGEFISWGALILFRERLES